METWTVSETHSGLCRRENSPREGKNTNDGCYSEHHRILKGGGGGGGRSLGCKECFSQVDWGAGTGRVWVVREEEQREERYRSRDGQNTEKGKLT